MSGDLSKVAALGIFVIHVSMFGWDVLMVADLWFG